MLSFIWFFFSLYTTVCQLLCCLLQKQKRHSSPIIYLISLEFQPPLKIHPQALFPSFNICDFAFFSKVQKWNPNFLFFMVFRSFVVYPIFRFFTATAAVSIPLRCISQHLQLNHSSINLYKINYV